MMGRCKQCMSYTLTQNQWVALRRATHNLPLLSLCVQGWELVAMGLLSETNQGTDLWPVTEAGRRVMDEHDRIIMRYGLTPPPQHP